MPNIFIASLVKSTDCIPQTCNPQISHLETVGFKPKKEESKANVSKSSYIDSLFSRKIVVSSA